MAAPGGREGVKRLNRQELIDSISLKAKNGLYSRFDAIYEELTTHIGTDYAVKVGIIHGIEIGAAAILDTLSEYGLLDLSE